MIIRSTARKYVQESNNQVFLNAILHHLRPSARAHPRFLSQSPTPLLNQTRPWFQAQPAAAQPSTHPSAIQLFSYPWSPCQYLSSSAVSSQLLLSLQRQRQPPAPSPRLALAHALSVSPPRGLDGSTRRRCHEGPAWRLASGPRGVSAGCVRSETGCGSRGRAGCLRMRRWTRQSAAEINARVVHQRAFQQHSPKI